MLEAIDLEKRFNDQIIFNHLSFQLPNHGLILLTGPSGSGKTTLLKILQLNLDFLGQLKFDGIDLNRLTLNQKNAFRMQFISSVKQEVKLIEHATVQEHLSILQHLKGHYQRPLVKQSIEQFLREVNPQQKVKSLSRGQQQRFAILLACIGNTKLLLLDEPTTGLDFQNRKQIYHLLEKLKSEQLIIMSSHQAIEDGLIPEVHLKLPNPIQTRYQIDKKKGKLIPTNTPPKWPLAWYWRFHFRQRQFQRFRKRMVLSQTFVVATLGVMMSLMMVIGKEMLRITNTMIGGEYQYVKPIFQRSIELESTMPTESIFKDLPLKFELRSFYDEDYFERLKPYHQFYIEDKGFEIILKDIHLGLVNYVENSIPFTPPQAMATLTEQDFILGVQTHHLKLLAQALNCFPTKISINQTLYNSPLPVYFKIYVPEWQYWDQTVIELKQIEITDEPQWFHTNDDYAKTFYEDRLRLPTRGIEEYYEFQPWRVAKTMMMQVNDDNELLSMWLQDESWKHYHLKKHIRLGWQIYKSEIPRLGFPTFEDKIKTFHYHSNLGYHYFPDQKLSGFSQPIFFHPNANGNVMYLETLKKLVEPFSWLNVVPPSKTSIGYILTNPGSSMKLKTDETLSNLSVNEIMVSASLLQFWNLNVGEKVYINHGTYPDLNETGTIFETTQSMLTIVDVIDMDGFWLFHHPHWLTLWLMKYAFIPSNLLEPEAWIFYQQVLTPNGYQSLNPLKEVESSIHEIQLNLILATGIWLFFIGIPLFILFFYYAIQSLIADIDQLTTLKGFGSPWSYIQQWYGIKFKLIAIEVSIPTLLLLIFMDYLLKRWLGEYFFLTLSYQIPLETILLFILITMLFYLVSKQIQMKILSVNFKNI
ncbi:MAG: ABC transporter ATP-binding protein [Bacilli bacterium]